jgi:hypothetical protein
MSNHKQSRKWLLTINNPSGNGFNHDEIKDVLGRFKAVKYWCMADETGKNDTYHTHLFIYGDSGIRFDTVKKKFPPAHIDYCRGTAQENRDYVRKEGKWKGSLKEETNHPETFEENGTVPLERQGQRNDLIDLYDMIENGMSDYEILKANPEYMVYLKTMESTRQKIRQEEFGSKIRKITVTYNFGKSGSGKTRSVLDEYGYGNVCRITNYKHPFDDYDGQDIILFEEFRSSIRFEEFLNYLDIYPLRLPSRYNDKTACYTKVYINTNIELDEQYRELRKEHPENWNALIRRIHHINEFTADGIKKYGSYREYRDRWQESFIPDNPFIKKTPKEKENEVFEQVFMTT